MKIFAVVFTLLALCITGYNVTKVNFEAPFEGDSLVACITILAALCAIILVWILVVSKQIQKLAK